MLVHAWAFYESVCRLWGAILDFNALPVTTCTSGNAVGDEGIETQSVQRAGGWSDLYRVRCFVPTSMHIRTRTNTEHHLPRGHDTI